MEKQEQGQNSSKLPAAAGPCIQFAFPAPLRVLVWGRNKESVSLKANGICIRNQEETLHLPFPNYQSYCNSFQEEMYVKH